MALKFRCKNCGEDLIVQFLKVGEAAECKNCGASNSVPESAESIDDEAATLYAATLYQSRARRPVADSESTSTSSRIFDSDEPKSPSSDKSRRNTGDFWAFRRMITPVIIQVIFWIGVVACVIGGIALIAIGNDTDEGGLIFIGIMVMLVGPVIVRIQCEMAVVFFRINETLTETKNEITEIKNGMSKPSE